jgi:hypothetical protein
MVVVEREGVQEADDRHHRRPGEEGDRRERDADVPTRHASAAAAAPR